MSSKPYFIADSQAVTPVATPYTTPYASTGQLTLTEQVDPNDVTTRKEDGSGHKTTEAVLAAKGLLVAQALDEIGWTNFHLKLFCFSGLGSGVGTLATMLQSIVAHHALTEFQNHGYPTGLTIAFYLGQLTGALAWGLSADIMGRRTAFKSTMFVAAIATLVAAASPNWIALGVFVCLLGFAVGGNNVLDPAVFLEFLPSKQKGTIVLMPVWWGIGQAVAGFIAWGYYSRIDWSCESTPGLEGKDCTWRKNIGWRLILVTGGCIVMMLALARILFVKMKETPNHLLKMGQDEVVVSELRALADKYKRPFSLTVQDLEACGSFDDEKKSQDSDKSQNGVGKALLFHFGGLFSTRKLAVSTCLIWLSWASIGIAYPLFYMGLPSVLASRVKDQDTSINGVWQNYSITSVCAIFGPIIAFGLSSFKLLGRRYTMSIGALLTGVLFCGYTFIHTSAQNIGLSSSISTCINIYYGTLYAYSAGVFPAAHRTTGNGISIAIVCFMSAMSAVVSQTSDMTTVTPLYISAGIFFLLAILAAFFPFETCDDDTA